MTQPADDVASLCAPQRPLAWTLSCRVSDPLRPRGPWHGFSPAESLTCPLPGDRVTSHRYDDWWTTACAVHRGAVDVRRQPSQPTRARLLVGEWRAHAKVAKEFNATLRCVAGSCRGPYDRYSRVDLFNQYAPIFLVTSVGAATASASRSPGLTPEGSSDGAGALYDDPKLLDNLLNHWPVCLHQGKRHRVEK
jgi:hypothetical protein